MLYHASGKHLNNPKVALHLWAYVEVGGCIQRIAGKSYVLEGTGPTKTSCVTPIIGVGFALHSVALGSGKLSDCQFKWGGNAWRCPCLNAARPEYSPQPVWPING